jgi:tetratricopeptide (TPR) repeat protein
VKNRLFLSLFAFLFFASKPVSAQTNVPQPGVTATSQSQPTSIQGEWKKINSSSRQFAYELEVVDKTLTSIIFSLAKLLVVLLSIFITKRIFLLVAYRSSQLIIDNFSNASGDGELEKVLPGISQLAREKLVQEMKSVYQRSKERIAVVGPQIDRPSHDFPLPQSTLDQQLTNFVSSLKELTPDELDPLVQMLVVIFPPYGTRVAAMLQSQGKDYEKLGISFEILDIESRIPSRLYTIWESPKVQNSDPIKDRYRLLLRSAMRWLGIELCRRETMAEIPWMYFGSRRKRYQGQIYNFFGVLNNASAPTHGEFFYHLAISDLQQAIKLYPEWYQPYESLADTYSTLGRESEEKEGINWHRQAVLEYDQALQRCEDESAKRRIFVGKAMALLLTGDQALIQEARQAIDKVEENWDYTTEERHRFLYHLACWYALLLHASSQDIPQPLNIELLEAQQKARRYLAFALVRDSDRTLWNWASKDPDLKSIREGFPELQFLLLKKLNEAPHLPKERGENFAKSIEEVLKQVNWL